MYRDLKGCVQPFSAMQNRVKPRQNNGSPKHASQSAKIQRPLWTASSTTCSERVNAVLRYVVVMFVMFFMQMFYVVLLSYKLSWSYKARKLLWTTLHPTQQKLKPPSPQPPKNGQGRQSHLSTY